MFKHLLRLIEATGNATFIVMVMILGAISIGGILLGFIELRLDWVLLGLGFLSCTVFYYYRRHPYKPFRFGLPQVGSLFLSVLFFGLSLVFKQ